MLLLNIGERALEASSAWLASKAAPQLCHSYPKVGNTKCFGWRLVRLWAAFFVGLFRLRDRKSVV